VKLESEGPERTEEIGYALGKRLKAGDVVALFGDLGSGKTTMVRGIARAFGIARRDVTSASFTIIAEYPGNPPFFHIDLYRIESQEELDGAGVWDCIGGDSVAVVEWAEKLGERFTKDCIRVEMENTGGDGREISIEGIDEEDRHYL
jgi:tRNA threonylcarbamoyladenosine biosynthesis protein TsaE